MQNSPVSSSEWQIMRILWELKQASSQQVIQCLKDSSTWSPTTIKTFLSRLVEKKLIGYVEQGKMYQYYPLITERDCVILEMKGILSRIYGGNLLHESDHFQFYGVQNQTLIARLEDVLEKSYERVLSLFGFHLLEKQMVYLYPSQNRFYSALGLSAAPEWLRAGCEWNILHISPESTFTDISIESATVHVWIQRVILEMNPSTPYWLQQGIATYESHWMTESRFSSALSEIKKNLSWDTIINMDSNYESFRSKYGYELSYTVVQYILTQYGWKSLKQFIQSPGDYEKAFSVHSETFWRQWVKYVQQIHDLKSGSEII